MLYFVINSLLVKDYKKNNNVEKQKLLNVATPMAFFLLSLSCFTQSEKVPHEGTWVLSTKWLLSDGA